MSRSLPSPSRLQQRALAHPTAYVPGRCRHGSFAWPYPGPGTPIVGVFDAIGLLLSCVHFGERIAVTAALDVAHRVEWIGLCPLLDVGELPLLFDHTAKLGHPAMLLGTFDPGGLPDAATAVDLWHTLRERSDDQSVDLLDWIAFDHTFAISMQSYCDTKPLWRAAWK
jgi:hypothetical protein